MKRSDMLQRLDDSSRLWDLAVIGGGATGLGIAVDAAERGYATVLLEQHDFAQATSSRSTKLIHGGVRYLRQGNLALVRESIEERGNLLANAPHLVEPLPFVVPGYRWWEPSYYTAGLKLYDSFAGKRSLGTSRYLSTKATLERLPNLVAENLSGGTLYYDAQFDDARLAVSLARTAADHNACIINHLEVTALDRQGQKVTGVHAIDRLSGQVYRARARVVINATGVFSDRLRRLEDESTPKMITPSQGIHLVLDTRFLEGDTALMVPRTDDGRVLFAIPWQGRLLLGTTDTGSVSPEVDPRPREEEVDYLLEHAARYLAKSPERSDIRAAFAGLRPLVKPGATGGQNGSSVPGGTSAISRDHSITVSEGGMVSIAGGKWTTYRKMAEDAVNTAAELADLKGRPCNTHRLRLNSSDESEALEREHPGWAERLHASLPYRSADVIAAVRYEMAMTVEDVLARRTRCLHLDHAVSREIAEPVARLMAAELDQGESWITRQLEQMDLACELPDRG